MITILGAGGAIGNELVKLLAARKQPFRLVARNPVSSPGAAQVATSLTKTRPSKPWQVPVSCIFSPV